MPGDLVVEHYAQRAGVGLIITEGTYPNRESQALRRPARDRTDEQVDGWRRVAEAVHAARRHGSSMQVMHGGRVTHPDINGGRPDRRAESPIAIDGEVAHLERASSPTRCRTR